MVDRCTSGNICTYMDNDNNIDYPKRCIVRTHSNLSRAPWTWTARTRMLNAVKFCRESNSRSRVSACKSDTLPLCHVRFELRCLSKRLGCGGSSLKHMTALLMASLCRGLSYLFSLEAYLVNGMYPLERAITPQITH